MLYDIVIEANDHPEKPFKVQAGDIKSMRPAGEPWGQKERRYSLIIAIELTDAEAKLLLSPWYKDGSFQPEIEAIEKIGLPAPVIIHKRRFKLPLNLLKSRFPELDLARVKDRDDPYQPFIDGEMKSQLTTAEKKALFFDKHRKSFKYKDGAVEVIE